MNYKKKEENPFLNEMIWVEARFKYYVDELKKSNKDPSIIYINTEMKNYYFKKLGYIYNLFMNYHKIERNGDT